MACNAFLQKLPDDWVDDRIQSLAGLLIAEYDAAEPLPVDPSIRVEDPIPERFYDLPPSGRAGCIRLVANSCRPR